MLSDGLVGLRVSYFYIARNFVDLLCSSVEKFRCRKVYLLTKPFAVMLKFVEQVWYFCVSGSFVELNASVNVSDTLTCYVQRKKLCDYESKKRRSCVNYFYFAV